ncbi:Protein-S-isoprenylcysteine O-methyltransferase Ste14 [Flaviramulus basaltis]|uniref:methanethiol S-methyltransferase n=1 Tax=Flaviramulus basaltis TaxID=369401 RepID=A0A1K2IAS1_9FLAO|nr:methanethiol S-methyltransferase [Flaviramulus basaltis]SFZ89370.1 Protein-S-isoprenylcysteine O-methyltransferase Ste14 [Flaviramulus basaltis]
MKKIIILIYGALAYIIFLIAFLYAIGFVGNMYVPKTIDSGVETSLSKAIIINIILLSVFAIQHSLMARPAFKKWFTSIISPAIERSTYVLLSSLALILLYLYWQPLTTVVWDVENQIIAFILIGVFFLGWLIVLLSTFMINHFELFGLAQIFNNLKNKQTENPKFQTNYLYKIIRHPIMLGFIIAFWATPVMTVGHLMFAVITTLYILIAIKFLEEKDLRKSIGEKYETYQKEVPMLIPFIKSK